MKRLLIAMALVLSGCATDATRTETVEVKVPVAVQPITREQIPPMPRPLPPRPKSLSAAADVLASKWCEAVSYFLRVDPLLRLSAGMPQQPVSQYPECERR